MEQIKEFLQLDFTAVIVSIFVIMSAIIAGYQIICKFSEIIKKPIGVAKQRKADHELLKKNSSRFKRITQNTQRRYKAINPS